MTDSLYISTTVNSNPLYPLFVKGRFGPGGVPTDDAYYLHRVKDIENVREITDTIETQYLNKGLNPFEVFFDQDFYQAELRETGAGKMLKDIYGVVDGSVTSLPHYLCVRFTLDKVTPPVFIRSGPNKGILYKINDVLSVKDSDVRNTETYVVTDLDTWAASAHSKRAAKKGLNQTGDSFKVSLSFFKEDETHGGGGGGGGSTTLVGLTDVDVAGAADGNGFFYNNATSKWEVTDRINVVAGQVVTGAGYVPTNLQDVATKDYVDSNAGGANKITNGGDTTGAPVEVGTNDGFSLRLRTDNVNRFTVDALGVLSSDTLNYETYTNSDNDIVCRKFVTDADDLKLTKGGDALTSGFYLEVGTTTPHPLVILTDSAARMTFNATSGLVSFDTPAYETLLTADNDIPNKKYVDDAAGPISNKVTKGGDVGQFAIGTTNAASMFIKTNNANRFGIDATTGLLTTYVSNYQNLVTIDNDIPNKRYVDNVGANKVTRGGDTLAASLVLGTNDSFPVVIETAGVARATVSSAGLISANTANYERLVVADNDLPNRKFLLDTTNTKFTNGGDSRGSAASLGTNDAFPLSVRVNNTTRATFATNGLIQSNTTNYEALVTANNDIPNRKFVVDADLTKLTIGGDSKGASVTVGTNDAFPLILETRGVARATVSAAGLISANTAAYEALVVGNNDIPNRKFVVDADLTKLTIGGDSKGAPITVGTNDNQPFSFETNGSSRVTLATTGLLSTNVAGYESLVVADGAFTNKKYVDDKINTEIAATVLNDLADVDATVPLPYFNLATEFGTTFRMASENIVTTTNWTQAVNVVADVSMTVVTDPGNRKYVNMPNTNTIYTFESPSTFSYSTGFTFVGVLGNLFPITAAEQVFTLSNLATFAYNFSDKLIVNNPTGAAFSVKGDIVGANAVGYNLSGKTSEVFTIFAIRALGNTLEIYFDNPVTPAASVTNASIGTREAFKYFAFNRRPDATQRFARLQLNNVAMWNAQLSTPDLTKVFNNILDYLNAADVTPAIPDQSFIRYNTTLSQWKASDKLLNVKTFDPNNLNDTTQGFEVSSRWVNTATDREYVCVDATTNAAIWLPTTAVDANRTGDIVNLAALLNNGRAGFFFDSNVTTSNGVSFDVDWLQGTLLTGIANQFTIGANNALTYTGVPTRTFQVSYAATPIVGSNDRTVWILALKNPAAIAYPFASSTLPAEYIPGSRTITISRTAVNDTESVAGVFTVSLATNDVLRFYVSNQENADAITISDFRVTINPMSWSVPFL